MVDKDWRPDAFDEEDYWTKNGVVGEGRRLVDKERRLVIDKGGRLNNTGVWGEAGVGHREDRQEDKGGES